MKSAALLSFALLLGPVALAAQSAGQGQSSYGVARMEGLNTANTATTVNPPINIGCPVFLHAQHRADGGLLDVDKNRPEQPAQLLHLTLTNPDSRQIVAARVRVHGLSGKARATQTLSSPGKADASRSLGVQFSTGPGKTVSGDLRVSGMTAVLSIDLNSVTFADGSTRSFTERDACRVAPDPFMPIGDR
jgi:hypothetical protein